MRLSFTESRIRFVDSNRLHRKSGSLNSPRILWREGNDRVSLLTQNDARLRKHADYQRVYQRSRKHFSPSMTYFFAERIAGPVFAPASGPRVGLTAGRVLGKAVERNRIKRRMREAVRVNLALLTRDVDVVLHHRR